MDAARALEQIHNHLTANGQEEMIQRLIAEFDAELLADEHTQQWLGAIDVQHDLFNQSETWEV